MPLHPGIVNLRSATGRPTFKCIVVNADREKARPAQKAENALASELIWLESLDPRRRRFAIATATRRRHHVRCRRDGSDPPSACIGKGVCGRSGDGPRRTGKLRMARPFESPRQLEEPHPSHPWPRRSVRQLGAGRRRRGTMRFPGRRNRLPSFRPPLPQVLIPLAGPANTMPGTGMRLAHYPARSSTT